MKNLFLTLIALFTASIAFSAEENLSCKLNLLKTFPGGVAEVASSFCHNSRGTFGFCDSDLYTEENGNVLRLRLVLHSRNDIPEVDLAIKRIIPYTDENGTQLISRKNITGNDIKKIALNSEYQLELNCSFTNSTTHGIED